MDIKKLIYARKKKISSTCHSPPNRMGHAFLKCAYYLLSVYLPTVAAPAAVSAARSEADNSLAWRFRHALAANDPDREKGDLANYVRRVVF
jgi:hypothetical protein